MDHPGKSRLSCNEAARKLGISGLIIDGYTLSLKHLEVRHDVLSKLSCLVSTVALIPDSGQVDGAKDFVRMESGSSA